VHSAGGVTGVDPESRIVVVPAKAGTPFAGNGVHAFAGTTAIPSASLMANDAITANQIRVYRFRLDVGY
jgi:hypothetical protein